MTLLEAVGSVGPILGVILAGIWLERRSGSAEIYRGLPPWAQLLVAGIAFGGPWIPYWEGLYPALPPDPLLWVLVLNLTLWIGIPHLLDPVVETGQPEAAC